MAANSNKISTEFRQYLPDLNSPRFQIAKEQDAYTYAATFQKEQNPPWLYNLTKAWEQLYAEPFQGVTSDGSTITDLFQPRDEGLPIHDIVNAVSNVLEKISLDQKSKLLYPINAKEWRAWSNPEFLLRPFGLRLEELPEDTVIAILRVLEVTLSLEGYQKAMVAMHMNQFLGELCQIPRIMNKYSYNFLVFGIPSATAAWGWSLYGHHLCLIVFIKGTQIIISPTFTGSEPNIDDRDGTQILHVEGDLGLQLMQSLPALLQQKAQVFKLLRDPDMLQSGDLTKDRWNQDDQRHMCGAFRDNRIVPYEGVCVGDIFTPEQQHLVLDIAEQFLLYLPFRSRALRKADIRAHFKDTYFCWIGGYGDDDAYYYRIQSPVAVFEFDHHSGVFLTNKEPTKFHIHTIVRTPNGGDYGNAIRLPVEKLLR